MTDRGPARGATRADASGRAGKAAREPRGASDPRALGLDDRAELAIVGDDEDAPGARWPIGLELRLDRRFEDAIRRPAARVLDEQVLGGSRRRAGSGNADVTRETEHLLVRGIGIRRVEGR